MDQLNPSLNTDEGLKEPPTDQMLDVLMKIKLRQDFLETHPNLSFNPNYVHTVCGINEKAKPTNTKVKDDHLTDRRMRICSIKKDWTLHHRIFEWKLWRFSLLQHLKLFSAYVAQQNTFYNIKRR